MEQTFSKKQIKFLTSTTLEIKEIANNTRIYNLLQRRVIQIGLDLLFYSKKDYLKFSIGPKSFSIIESIIKKAGFEIGFDPKRELLRSLLDGPMKRSIKSSKTGDMIWKMFMQENSRIDKSKKETILSWIRFKDICFHECYMDRNQTYAKRLAEKLKEFGITWDHRFKIYDVTNPAWKELLKRVREKLEQDSQ